MKDVKRDNDWAWQQIEAMADNSLVSADRRRMREAMRQDSTLDDAVECAHRLQKELRQLSPPPVPRGLRGRLLDIPSNRPRTTFWLVVPAVPAIVVIIGFLLVMRPPPPTNDASVALEEFRVAMTYLQKSAAITNEEVTTVLRDGLGGALSVSRSAVFGEDLELEQGDGDDD